MKKTTEDTENIYNSVISVSSVVDYPYQDRLSRIEKDHHKPGKKIDFSSHQTHFHPFPLQELMFSHVPALQRQITAAPDTSNHMRRA